MKTMLSRTAKILAGLIGLLALALNVGCSAQGQLDDLTQRTTSRVFGQLTGIVPGSQQNQVVNGYNISASVGAGMSGITQTTSGGYKVYSTVQGNLASESQVTRIVQ